MTYPQQPYQPYPPQAYPQQPPFPPPAYPQQPYQQQPYPQQPAAPAPVPARGTLEDFLDQPSAGGGAAVTKFFKDRVQGSWLQLQITRDLTSADVRQQTDAQGNLQTFKASGKPKLVLVLPVTVLQSSDGSHPGIFTEGVASVWLKGVTSDSFKQALATAGISSPDKAIALGKLGGAVFTMASAGEKPSNRPGFSPTKLYTFTYTPNGHELSENAAPAAQAAPAAAPAAPVAPPAAQAPPAPPAAPVATPAVQAPPAPPAGFAPAAPPAAPPAPSAAPGQPPLDAERAQLLARLQGQQG